MFYTRPKTFYVSISIIVLIPIGFNRDINDDDEALDQVFDARDSLRKSLDAFIVYEK